MSPKFKQSALRKMQKRADTVNKEVRAAAEREAFRREMRGFTEAFIRERNKKLNQLAVETADKMGINVWDLCSRYVPHYSVDATDVGTERSSWEQTMSLVPEPLAFDDCIDYKTKYLALKERLEEILKDED
jgi:hypothetical protein